MVSNFKFFKTALGVGGVYASSILGPWALTQQIIKVEKEKNPGRQCKWRQIPTRHGMTPQLGFVEPKMDKTETTTSTTRYKP